MNTQKTIKKPVINGVARVPIIMQMEALECGAACLAMVSAYYGKWIPLEQVRSDCGVSRDGANARNILFVARKYGFEAQGFRFEPETIVGGCKFPCIIHWNFKHFVVLKGFKHNRAYINDPAKGEITVSMKEFDESFTGITLMCEPGESFEPGGKPKSLSSFIKKRIKGTERLIAFVALTSIIAYLFGIINPIMTRVFMDRLLSGQNSDWLGPFIGLMALLAFLQIIIQAASAVYSLKINGKIAVTGSSSFIWKLLKLPMEFFSQRMAGDVIQRVTINSTLSTTLVVTLAPLALNGLMMVFYLVIMIRYSLVLTCVGLFSILINLIMSRYISKKRVNATRVQARDAAKLSSTTVNGIAMIETIKSSGSENGFFEKWSGYQASLNSQTVKLNKMNTYLGIIPGLVSSLSSYSVLFLGIYYAMNADFTLGMIMAFQSYLNSFTAPAMSFISASQTIQETRTEMERVEDVMEYQDDPYFKDEPLDETQDCSKLTGNIEIKNISFGYSRLSDPLIKDFSMSVKQGQSVAFVGTSGCGKSTIAKLISGLVIPWSGEILFDGLPIDKIHRSVFKGSLAVVDQDIILFEDTMENNIKMWDRTIEDFEMILAAKDAQIHDDITKREGGYQRKLTEDGKDLSGGQRQRLEIARVLALDPSIIILDEATSALDAKTEYEVVKAIRDRGITCIVVAHRLSTIRDCDEIIVMNKGEVVERGTHQELYKQNGLYTQLIASS